MRIIVKGAPESVIPKCKYYLDGNNIVQPFHGDCDLYLEHIVSEQIAKQGHEPLTYAFKDINIKDFVQH